MTLRAVPENGSPGWIIPTGGQDHRVYFPPGQISNAVFNKLATISGTNLRRATLIEYEDRTVIKNTERRTIAQGTHNERIDYDGGEGYAFAHKKYPEGGLRVKMPDANNELIWVRLKAADREDGMPIIRPGRVGRSYEGHT